MQLQTVHVECALERGAAVGREPVGIRALVRPYVSTRERTGNKLKLTSEPASDSVQAFLCRNSGPHGDMDF